MISASRVYVASGSVERVYYVEKLLISPEARVKRESRVASI